MGLPPSLAEPQKPIYMKSTKIILAMAVATVGLSLPGVAQERPTTQRPTGRPKTERPKTERP